MSLQSFGVIGLAVMGENLALNVESRGFPIAVYNRSRNKTDNFMATRAQGKQVKAAYTIEEFVGLLQRPRNILIMVQSDAVKKVIEELKPFLNEGDVIIDGGNSLYTETDERTKELDGTGFTFIGMGISGGEEGALNGPSMMPGGTEAAYKNVEPILNAIAAKVDGT
jgi:6-phosphogluconate dehydrogenase